MSDTQPSFVRVTPPSFLVRQGGHWLGSARNFLQRKAFDGDRLTWGSQREVRGLTVSDIEEMASEIASAAINQDRADRARRGEDLIACGFEP